MGKKISRVKESIAEYYDRREVLAELQDESVEFSLEEELRSKVQPTTRRCCFASIGTAAPVLRSRRPSATSSPTVLAEGVK